MVMTKISKDARLLCTANDNIRNCHCSRHLRCLRQPLIRLCRPPVASSINEPLSHFHIPHKILSRSLRLYTPRRAMEMVLVNRAYTQHPPLMSVVPGVLDILNQDYPLVARRMATVRQYCLLQIPLLEAACQRKIRT